jgi:glycoside/pentoside/hexuronide:cation symporter, GPH family
MSASNSAGRGFARLPFKLKLGYSAGQLVDGIVTNGLNIFLLFYLTAVCGLPGGLAGAALSVGLVVDALMDPLIGSTSDACHARLGRRLPFMLVGAPATALLFVLIFSLPRGWSTTSLFLWVTVLSVLLRVSLSAFLLPYQAVGAEITDDDRERTSLVAWRWGVGILGTLGAVLLGFGVFFAGAGGLSQRGAYTPFAATLATILLLGAAVSAWAVAATRGRQYPPAREGRQSLARLGRELLEIFHNRSFLILFTGALLFFVALGTNMSLGLHANTFFWHLNTAQTQWVTLSIFIGLLAGAPLAGPLLAWFEKRTVVMVGMIGMAVGQGGPAALRLCGLLDASGGALTAIIVGVTFVSSVLMATSAIAFGSMMADAADEHEHLFGARREGLYFAGWAFASKAATGGGILIAGLVLQAIAFPSDAAKAGGAAFDLTPHMVAMLGFFYGPGSALLTLAATALSSLYRLNRKAHAAILVDLGHRRNPTAGDLGHA